MVEDVLEENRAVQTLESDVLEDLFFPSAVVDRLLRNSIYESLMKFSSSI